MTRITVVSPTGGGYIYEAGDALDRNASVTYSETDYTMIGQGGARVVYRGVFDVDSFGNFVGGAATSIDIYNNTGSRSATIDQISFNSDQFVNQKSSLGLFTRLGATSFYGDIGGDSYYGSQQADTVYGGDGNDFLQSNGGADQMFGENGKDSLLVGDDGDFADGGDDIDIVYLYLASGDLVVRLDTQQPQQIKPGATVTLRNIENVIGGAGADDITGSRFNNTLDGGTGFDTLRGGIGDDTYRLEDVTVYDNGGGFVFTFYDFVEEIADGGIDTIIVYADEGRNYYTLGANIENLEARDVTGVGGYVLTGNAVANSIKGADGADTIDGGVGNDTLESGSGSDILIGGVGVDAMSGSDGSDTYWVDNAGDVLIEAGAGGTVDRVFSSTSYGLGAGWQIDLLATNGIANATAINLTGNEVAQTLQGNAGKNVLVGGGGADTMAGYGGADDYWVDNAGDVVTETGAGGSVDRVFASVSYGLGAGQQIDLLATNGVTKTTAIDLSGNEFAQTLQGNAGRNVLVGGGGADTMAGYGGADDYWVDNAGDVVTETGAGGTVDRVFSSVSYTLGAGQQIDVLATNGITKTAAVNLTGNDLAQALQGNAGANVLAGRGGGDALFGFGGADRLYGGLGNDKLDGGAGNDVFVFDTGLNAATNVDTINAYSVAADTIWLDDAVFLGLARGGLSSAAFTTGAAATDGADRIVYNGSTGALLFDRDGSGSTYAAVQFAKLAAGLAMAAGEFAVV